MTRTDHSHPQPGSRAAVSIHDVAVEAQVSIATVSRVMNNPSLVAPKTAERVLEVIKRIGYHPNPFAQGLMTRESRVLGFALPDIHGEFYSELLRGADAESRRLGYHLLVTSEPRGGEADSRGLAFGLIDGLAVMITNPDAAMVRLARESRLPTVVLDMDLKQPGIDSVVVDNDPGTREGVDHLLKTTRPGNLYFVGGPADNFDTQQRSRAFVTALKAAGYTPRTDQTVFGDYTPQWGREWLDIRMQHVPIKDVGVLAGNDEIAIGLMHAAQDRGISIPGELRVVGFDDTRLAQLVRPRLSTVRVPMAEVGAAAVQLLVKRVEDPETGVQRVVMATGLVVRESSG